MRTRPDTGPLHVPSLTAAERDQVMPELVVWVNRLVDRFALDSRTIPPCWERHNAMVEALAALRDYERGSFGEDADPRSGVEWLRALREIRSQLGEFASLTQCSAQQHREPPARMPTPQHGDAHPRRE
jgi:hypothetical protein